ncbi:MAG TPA: glutamate--tRNA ligase [Nanoarchaeota archaeon]|nr:glutamate--tRNA ligase [Nanoarchaeota archaeon]
MLTDDILKYALHNAVKYGGKASPGAVIGKIFAEHPELKEKSAEVAKEVNAVIKEVNKAKPDAQLKQLESLAPELLEKKEKPKTHELPELNNAVDGQVVMRMAPYPSGPLHIGNARPYLLNDEYAKKYNGKLLLVLDDTIGSEEKNITKEAYDMIPEGLKWLGVVFDPKLIYKSDRMDIYYKYAEELIKAGKAYVCFCDSETLRTNRAEMKICEHREATVEKTMDEWKKMFTEYKEGEAALRIKTSMDNPNPAFRDRVIFRVCEREHPRVSNKYRVWPLLDFSWAIDDHLLGITHVMRGKDLMIESDMEKYIWDIFGWKHAELIHIGLVQLEGVKISKSKAKKEVMSGEFSGWDDPRTWSLQALRRRGILPEAIRMFSLSFGVNPNEITVPVDSLYAENRKMIDASSNRYFFVDNPQKIKIANAPEMDAELDLHQDFKERGKRKLHAKQEFYVADELKKGKVYRFIHLFNFKDGEFVSKEHDTELNAQLIHWLPANEGNAETEILMPDGTLKKGLAEKDVKHLKIGDEVQFERFGFCRLDRKEKDKLVFWYTHR